MLENFDVRSGVSWMSGRLRIEGVVVGKTSDMLYVIPALPARRDTKCYNEGGSLESRDGDKVRLTTCPPPCSAVCASSPVNSCYVKARKASILKYTEQDLMNLRFRATDNGAKISEDDLKAIFDHPWFDEMQMGLKQRKLSATERLNMALATPADVDRYAGDDGGLGL